MMPPAGASAQQCNHRTFGDQGYTLCEVEVGRDDLRLFLDNPETGAPLGSFVNLAKLVEGQGLRLGFAMNAGMYHPDRHPVGLYVEAGRKIAAAVARAGPGNFGMLPNGVFCIEEGRFRVIETHRYLEAEPACRFATQSGPMLVIDGALHPRFSRGSDSRFVRNGVGVSADGQRAYFVISDAPVNFYDFARFFLDGLGTPQALYLDGKISRLYAPSLDRHDGGFPMGPMVGVVCPAPD